MYSNSLVLVAEWLTHPVDFLCCRLYKEKWMAATVSPSAAGSQDEGKETNNRGGGRGDDGVEGSETYF
jgi:hypothetical protein